MSRRQTTSQTDAQRIAALEAALAARDASLAVLTERAEAAETALANLRRAYTKALEELQLQKRRLFAKSERGDDLAEQLSFDKLFERVEALAKQIEAAEGNSGEGGESGRGRGKGKGKGATNKPSGRRDLSESDLPVVRIEVLDEALEGKAERIGFETSWRLAYQRGGMRRIQVATAVYKDPTSVTETAPEASADAERAEPTLHIVRTEAPRELFRRALLAPSMIAHVLTAKYLLGVPFYRLEQSFELQGASLDRGTMSRYAEDAGATLGAIVLTMRDDAMASAFCLATDATGVSILPGPLPEKSPRRPCRKGHFFVVLADRDHVFFEYQEKHTSATVCDMFKGYRGYIQADAHGIYDALFSGRAPPGRPREDAVGSDDTPTEVGCWSHARRHFWEAAVCKHPLGIEGMRRIDAIFAADALLDDMAPARRKQLRDQAIRPMVAEYFAWIELQRVAVRERGLVASALGYSHNQREALERFLEDGRLRLDNNRSERALRTVAMDRSLCTSSSSARNCERAIVARIATRATCTLAAVA